MDLSYFILGYYTIKLKSEDFRRFWSICMYHGLSFRHLKLINEQEYECQIRCDSYEKIMEIAKRTQVAIEVIKKKGLPLWIEKFKSHMFFLIGAFTALFLLYYLSGCLWNIQIEGNCYYGDEVIKRFLTDQRIICGMRISNISCSELSEDIRMSFPRVNWTSCEISGCDLIIHLKENPLQEDQEAPKEGAYDLIAEKDGIIQNVFVRQGIAQVEIGQSVKKGDILISGYIPIENDAMEVIAYQPVVSDGDIMISGEYSYYHEIERRYPVYHVVDEIQRPYLKIGDYLLEGIEISLFGKKKEAYIDQSISKNSFKITDSLAIPIMWGEKTQRIYERKEEFYTDDKLRELSETYFYEFCANLEKKGVQIYENNVKMVLSDASCKRSGMVFVLEKTGELKMAQKPSLDLDITEE